jgi:uncharacterized protein (DUF1778 family)
MATKRTAENGKNPAHRPKGTGRTGKPTVPITIKPDVDEVAELDAAADKSGTTRAAFIRDAALRAARRLLKKS